jgi:hypothetical protein
MSHRNAAQLFLAFGVLAALASPEPARAGTSGGTITFVGSVSAPPFAIATSTLGGGAGNTRVSFSAPPATPSSVTVHATALDGRPLPLRCSGDAGTAASTANQCRVSGTASAVEFGKKAGTNGLPSNAVVSVDYD